MYQTGTFATRRRFQDFVFLRDHLSKDFPACVVPPLPDKHRLGVSAAPVWQLPALIIAQSTSLATASPKTLPRSAAQSTLTARVYPRH
jgi:hypothetical protein